MKNYDGLDVIDADGNKIGSVEHTYVNDAGQPQYVEVKIGTVFAKHRLVPLDHAQAEDNGLHVPYTKSTIENSPDVSGSDGNVAADTVSNVENFYQGAPMLIPPGDANQGDATTGDGINRDAGPGQQENNQPPVVLAENTGDIQDRGSFIDVPILDPASGGAPIVKEILRIPKKQGDAVPSSSDQQIIATAPSASGQTNQQS